MNAEKILFAGPSIAGMREEVSSELTVLPPCRQGDIYLAARDRPDAIAIVDGYFEGQPSVWHKEILWALSQGVHVLGASSMGALRAAELDVFGMVGLGKIYQWYRDGDIEDDDEVALIHAPEQIGFRPLSIAMVNVRATCRNGVECGAISPETVDIVISAAKTLFYQERTWGRLRKDLLDGAADCGGDQEQLKSAVDWLAENGVDQKEQDAREICEFLGANDFSSRFEPQFDFEETEFWYRNIRVWGAQSIADEGKDSEDGYRLFS